MSLCKIILQRLISFIFSNITLVKIVLNFLFHLFYQESNRYLCSVLLH